jgi:hypothetical protein
MMTDQQLNSRLLFHGAHTSGSRERRLDRLFRFENYNHAREFYRNAKITADLNLRGRLNQSERSAAWALLYLRNYANEGFHAIDIPTTNEHYDYCVRERNGTMYYVQVKPPLVRSS